MWGIESLFLNFLLNANLISCLQQFGPELQNHNIMRRFSNLWLDVQYLLFIRARNSSLNGRAGEIFGFFTVKGTIWDTEKNTCMPNTVQRRNGTCCYSQIDWQVSSYSDRQWVTNVFWILYFQPLTMCWLLRQRQSMYMNSTQNYTTTGPLSPPPTHPFPFLLWASFTVLHNLHTGRRVPLSGAPARPVKPTSAANVMRAIHLEKSRTSGRWRTSGPRRPSNCHIQGFLIYPLYH